MPIKIHYFRGYIVNVLTQIVNLDLHTVNFLLIGQLERSV